MSTIVINNKVATIVVRFPGPPGPPGSGSGAGFTQYGFVTPATTQTIHHGLGRHPAVVQAMDLTGQPVQVGVSHIDNNTTVISTTVPFAGSAWVG